MPDKEGCGPIKVLLIPPLMERNSGPLMDQAHPDFRHRLTVFSIYPTPRRDNGAVDYEKLLELCRELIKKNNIGVVYANKQAGSFVAAILCKEFPHLRGPTVESVFLCNHKYYTTEYVDSQEDKLPYHVLSVDGDIYDTAQQVLMAVQLPCIVRCCLSSGHTFFCAYNRDQLLGALERCRKDVMHIVDLQRWMLQTYISREDYPMATRHVVLLNTYLDRFLAIPGSTWTNVNIEGCVFQGDFIPWAICDAVTLPYGNPQATHSFSGFQMPSKLADFQQEALWRRFRKDVSNLQQKGFDNSFVFAKYMVFEDGYVHLVTMNACVNARCTPMYKKGLKNGNNLEAAIQVGLGIKPEKPQLLGNYVLSCSLHVFESGKADSLFHFYKALKNPDVVLRYLPRQEIVIEPAKNFAVVGLITVAGKDFQDCLDKIKEVKTTVLKLPELIPLTR